MDCSSFLTRIEEQMWGRGGSWDFHSSHPLDAVSSVLIPSGL